MDISEKATFIVTRPPSSAWNEELPMHEQVGWDDHANFMDASQQTDLSFWAGH